MPSHAARRAAYLLLATALATPYPSHGEGEAENARRFLASADPGVAVLTVELRGGMDGERTRYAVFGDGRLEIDVRDHQGNLRSHSEADIGLEELESLVRTAVDSRLLETKPDGLYDRMAADSEGRRFEGLIHDGAEMHLQVQLEHLEGSGDGETPVVRRVQVTEPGVLLEVFPNYPELQGMTEIWRRLRALQRMDSGSPGSKGGT